MEYAVVDHTRLTRLLLAAALAATSLAAGGAVRPALATLAYPASAGLPRATLQRVLDDARAKSGSPGASATVMRDGKLLWQGSSGVADRASGLPVTARTLYSLASVTKMFVATTVLRLYEEGDLRLDDRIAPFVPPYVPDAGKVTIRNLLGHTSGYPDAEGNPVILRWLADPNHVWQRDQVLRRIEPVRFPPGKQFSYCNSCYVMLGGIIHTATGAEIGGEFERLVVRPLRLEGDAVFERVPQAADRIAHGYDNRNKLTDTFAGARLLGVPTGVWGVMWTDGGLAASATGVARFTDALFGGHVLQPRTLAMMIDPGPEHTYGLGTYHMPFDGHTWQGHDGFYYGFTTMTMYDFTRRLTITVLTNLTDNSDPAYAIWSALTKAVDRLP
jgi:D-alanyl-D-alanine carboxypeptidase